MILIGWNISIFICYSRNVPPGAGNIDIFLSTMIQNYTDISGPDSRAKSLCKHWSGNASLPVKYWVRIWYMHIIRATFYQLIRKPKLYFALFSKWWSLIVFNITKTIERMFSFFNTNKMLYSYIFCIVFDEQLKTIFLGNCL